MEVLKRHDTHVLDIHLKRKVRGLEQAPKTVHLLFSEQGRVLILHDRQQNILQNSGFQVLRPSNRLQWGQSGLDLAQEVELPLSLA